VAEGPAGLSDRVGFVGGDPESGFVVDVVEDEVAFALEQRALPPPVIRSRVDEALARVGLEGFQRRTLRSLSGGEAQRVAVASALALRPQVLVLDEPTSQLDDESAAVVLDAVRDLARQGDLTLVASEHRLDRMRWVDRVVELPRAGAPPRVESATAWFAGPHAPEAPAAPATAPGDPVLEMEGITFGYGEEAVLTSLSLCVRAGEVVALTGPSGSGKTTLLRLAVGLLRPTAGRVRAEGRPIDGWSVAEICRRVAFLPQDPGTLLFAATVRAELGVTLANHGLPRDPDRERRLLGALGISELAESYPRDLSTGQRQRAALAAVSVTDPPLLLLDEPTRGLDGEAIAALARLLHERAAAGAGVLVASHDRRLTRAAHREVRLGA
jgi:energy-coupling factor transport system ATP-binding protein